MVTPASCRGRCWIVFAGRSPDLHPLTNENLGILAPRSRAARMRVRAAGYTGCRGTRDELWTKSARGEGRGRGAEGDEREGLDRVRARLARGRAALGARLRSRD